MTTYQRMISRKLLAKPPRSALTLPRRYVLRKPLKSGWGYFFNVPIWARKAGCPVKNEALGINYEVAVTRAETVLYEAGLNLVGNYQLKQ